MTKKIVISGFGRVGKLLLLKALEDEEFEVVAVLEEGEHPLVGTTQSGIIVTADPQVISKADLVIEFSTKEAVLEHLAFAKAMLIATTGLEENEPSMTKLREAAEKIPILLTSNVTLGMNALFVILPLIAKVLVPAGWKGKIEDIHHKMKSNQLSGTAVTVIKEVMAASGQELSSTFFRAGGTVGFHGLWWIAPSGEMLRFEHFVQSREDFAADALAFAKMMSDLPPGLIRSLDLIQQKLGL